MTYEAQIVLLAGLLYVFDCALLLRETEGLIVLTRHGWRSNQGTAEYSLAEKFVCLLNLFTPYSPTFRLGWSIDSEEPDTADSWKSDSTSPTAWSESSQQLREAMPFSVIAALSLFLFLPIGLLSPWGRPWVVVLALASLYTNIGLVLWVLRRSFVAAEISKSDYARLVFECIACPPFGVNAVRRTTLNHNVRESFIEAAERLLSDDEASRVKSRCVQVIRDAYELEEEGSTRADDLQTRMKQLASQTIPQ